MNDLRNVRDVLYSFSHCVKDEYQDLYVSIVGMIDSYMDKEQLTPEQYTDDESMPPWGHSDLEYDPAYSESTKMQIYKNYRAAIDEYNKLQERYETLLIEHGELQDLFYRVDSELDELKVKYDQCQKNYHTIVRAMKQSLT
jgi:hypothetical protein